MLATHLCETFLKEFSCTRTVGCRLSNNRSVHAYVTKGFILVVSTVCQEPSEIQKCKKNLWKAYYLGFKNLKKILEIIDLKP